MSPLGWILIQSDFIKKKKKEIKIHREGYQRHRGTEEQPCKEAARRWLSAGQGERQPQGKPTLPAPAP